jgi:hypothetical protein
MAFATDTLAAVPPSIGEWSLIRVEAFSCAIDPRFSRADFCKASSRAQYGDKHEGRNAENHLSIHQWLLRFAMINKVGRLSKRR